MIKFLKREWFKLSIVTILGVTSLCLITNISEAKNDYKINKSDVKTVLENINNTINYDKINTLSNRALANIEYLKLEELEKISKELKRFNDNYKKTITHKYDRTKELDLK